MVSVCVRVCTLVLIHDEQVVDHNYVVGLREFVSHLAAHQSSCKPAFGYLIITSCDALHLVASLWPRLSML